MMFMKSNNLKYIMKYEIYIYISCNYYTLSYTEREDTEG